MTTGLLVNGLDLVAGTVVRDLVQARHSALDVWREVRRYDPPAQAALYAAHQVLKHARDPAHTALATVAPGRAGSPEMFQWVRRIEAGWGRERAGDAIRMNPVHTLHAVDNLALSALSLAIGARGFGVGLGGAPGQAWSALDLLAQRIRQGPEVEGLVFAGDQADAEAGGAVCGVALLFARGGTRPDAVARVSWDRSQPEVTEPDRDVTVGLATLWQKVQHHSRAPRWGILLPPTLVDGRTGLLVRGELP